MTLQADQELYRGPENSLRGNSVRVVTPSTDPQGEVLSMAADQTRSGGHMKPAGPMSSDVVMAPTVAGPRTPGKYERK